MKKFLDSFKLAVWTAEFVWKVVTFLIVGAGGTTAALLASGLEVFRGFGWLAWYSVGLLAALASALIIYLVRAAQRANSEALVNTAMAGKSTKINPLSGNFTDEIIYISDLYLPGKQVHEHKQFRRCKFVGPGAIGIIGGNFVRSGFIDIGAILAIPDNTPVTGITVLMNCTVEDCEFYRTTVIIARGQVQNVSQIPGVQIAM